MSAVLMKGAPLAARIREQVAADVAELGHVGLATVLVGDDPASHIYVDHKHRAADEAGHREPRPPAVARDDRRGASRASSSS